MRALSIIPLVLVLFSGCSSVNKIPLGTVDNNGQQVENVSQTNDDYDHVIALDTEYYTTGPQQGRPPDGKFPSGTKVAIVEEAVHKAYVDVNEEGTEAAAATGVAIQIASLQLPTKPAVFRADHPFVFLIRDNRNDCILFMGRIRNPLQ